MSACRPRARWTSAVSATPTGCVGNADETAALELTVSGPTLRFHAPPTIALAGANMPMKLDGAPLPHNQAVTIGAGQVLSIGAIDGPGQRSYLAISGGIAAPEVLGSRATFALGKFGGHATGTLRTGEVLHLARTAAGCQARQRPGAAHPRVAGRRALWSARRSRLLPRPRISRRCSRPPTKCTSTPPAPVSASSARRRNGPAPDGGEAGLHPSNLHDNAYAVGAIDFTGDMPIILGPDGPSLGGFVCPAVMARDEAVEARPVQAGRHHPLCPRRPPR